MSWWVYIIRATNGKLYTGIAKDIEARFEEHCTGKRGAKFFRTTSPESVVYRQSFEDKGTALKREIAIKRLTKSQKEALIREFALALDSPMRSTDSRRK